MSFLFSSENLARLLQKKTARSLGRFFFCVKNWDSLKKKLGLVGKQTGSVFGKDTVRAGAAWSQFGIAFKSHGNGDGWGKGCGENA